MKYAPLIVLVLVVLWLTADPAPARPLLPGQGPGEFPFYA